MSRRHILSLSAIAVLGLVVLPNIAMARHKSLRVRPETSGRIAEFSEHEAD